MEDMTQFSQGTKLENQKNKKNGWLFAIYSIITMCIYILPAAKLTIPYLIAGSLMLISLVIIALQDDKMLEYSLFLVFVSFYFLLLNLIKGMSIASAINDMIRNLRFFLPVMWGIYCIKNIGKKQQKTIIFCFLLISGFILIKTLIALEENHWIARILAQDQSYSDSEVNQYRLDNVGGYSFSYMMGAVALIITWFALTKSKFWIKLLCFICLILCYYYLIQTMYTTLLLFVSIGIVIIIIFMIKNKYLKSIPFFLFALTLICLPAILEYASGLFGSDSLLSTKFMQMHDAITGEGVDALGARPELISNAIYNWLNAPLFGGAYNTPTHSVIFEYLQQSGIVGLSLWLFLFYISWKVALNQLKKNKLDIRLFNIISLYLFVLSIFNDTKACYEITIVVFFITTVLSMLFCRKNKVGL